MAVAFINDVKNAISSNIPTSAGIISEIIRVIYDKKSNAGDLADIFEHDPPLTAKILKVANSAYYGSNTTIESIQRAVVILGFNTIKEIVTTITIAHHFFNSRNSTDTSRFDLWLHSVGTAKAVQLISKRTNQERTDISYTTGLLHDIGRILLAIYFPEKFDEVVQLAAEKKCRIILAEQKILNTDHCMIGKILCDMWKLPEEISTTIFYHHDPMMTTKGSQMMARIISLGDYMCRKAEIGNPGDDVNPEPSPAIMATLGHSSSKNKLVFDEIFQEFLKSKEDIEGFFSGLK